MSEHDRPFPTPALVAARLQVVADLCDLETALREVRFAAVSGSERHAASQASADRVRETPAIEVRLLAGLPSSGPMALGFPAEWGAQGHEGTVVEFTNGRTRWTGNFAGGYGITLAQAHPNQRDAVVIAGGQMYVVDIDARSAHCPLASIQDMVEVNDPDGWIFDISGLALVRFGSRGVVWHTRRLSWDGLRDLRIDNRTLTGGAWSPLEDRWMEFQVDLITGRSTGGSMPPEIQDDWEKLAE